MAADTNEELRALGQSLGGPAKPKTAGALAIERLEKATATYRERNAVYQDSFKRWGAVFVALFPDGVHARTADDWNRLTTIGHLVDKLVRYTTDFARPHEDSIHDLGVYAFILQGLDAEIAQHRVELTTMIKNLAASQRKEQP